MRQESALLSVSENLTRVMMSRQPATELRTVRGNEYGEAGGKETSGRNASEGIEPRND